MAVFDKDGDGFITLDELRTVMTNIGEKISEEEIRDMIEEADTDKNGVVDFKGDCPSRKNSPNIHVQLLHVHVHTGPGQILQV